MRPVPPAPTLARLCRVLRARYSCAQRVRPPSRAELARASPRPPSRCGAPLLAAGSRVGSGKGSVNSAVGAPSKLARKQSVASSGQVARKAAAAATANGTGTLPAGAGLLAASGSRTPVGGGSMAAGRSIAADARSEGRSSVGSAASGIASKGRVGTQEYNDSAARVAKLLKARHYTRFAREARVTRRLDELAVLAAGGAPVDGAAKARAAGGGGTLAPKER